MEHHNPAQASALPIEPPLRRTMIDIGDPSGKAMAAIVAGDPTRPVDMVFAHANGFNAHTYRHILTELGKVCHVIAPDLRGHGLTRLPADPALRRDWRDYAADLRALVERVASQPIVLAGHSMGGASSVIAAAAGTPHLAGLVLFDPVMFDPAQRPQTDDAPPPIAEAAMRRRAEFASRAEALASYTGRGAFASWPREVVGDYVHDGLLATADGGVRLSCAPAWEASNFLCAGGQNHWHELAQVTCPVHIVRGTQGTFTHLPPDLAPLVAVDDWPEASHFAPMEHADRTAALLLRKLTEWTGRG